MTQTKANLVRALGVVGVSATIFNCTVGGGIFRLPGMVYGTTQTWTPVVYVVCGFLMILIGLCFAIVGRQTLETGGPYAYTKQAFGSFAGVISGALLWMLGTFSSASVADAFLSSLATIYPAIQIGWIRAIVLLIVFGALILMNTRGVKRGFIVLSFFTILKLFAIAVLIVFGFLHFHPENVVIKQPFETATFARSCMILIFAYLGIESALVPGGEVKNPERTIPISIVISLVSVTIIYFLVQIVCQSTLGTSLTEHADAPLIYASQILMGDIGKIILLAGSLVSMLGFLMGMMLAIPRVLFVMASDGFLHHKLQSIHPKYHTPNTAIVLQGIIVVVFAISGSFNSLAIFANLSTIILYIFCIVASAKIYFIDGQSTKKSSVYNGMILLMMIISVLIMGWLLTSVTSKEWIYMALACAAFSLLYAVRSKKIKTT